MLKAFEYSEIINQDEANTKIKNEYYFNKELEIAKGFVDKSVQDRNKITNCPVCKGETFNLFYNKWGIDYYRCDACFSIVADVDEKMVEEFQNSNHLHAIRNSDILQKEIEEKRDFMWDEFIEWLSFRSYRYLGKNKGLNVIDYGNRYEGFVKKIKASDLVNQYELRGSILEDVSSSSSVANADLILCLDVLQQKVRPFNFLKDISSSLKDNGILIIRSRVGSGFDILTLREHNKNIYPLEHNFLPSTEGLQILLEEVGYELLEITTPGMFDIDYVLEHKDKISESDYFIKYLLNKNSKIDLADFQRFLQKSGMSSFSQIIVKKKKRGSQVEN